MERSRLRGHSQDQMYEFVAFDMIQYDDVNAFDYLSKGPAHILVRVADRWYAFDRHELHSMMKEKRHFLLGVGELYTTPYHQTITASAWEALLCEKYSIYELIRCYDSVGSMTLYAVKCLSLEEWQQGEMGKLFEPAAANEYWLIHPTLLSLPPMGGPLSLIPYCSDEGEIFRVNMDAMPTLNLASPLTDVNDH